MKKNILITGASKGIGKAIKMTLEEKGFNCIVPERSELDISNLASIEAYFLSLEVEIDGLVNNAGINVIGDIDSIKDSDVEKMINVNLIAPLKIIQFVVKGMKRKGGGGLLTSVPYGVFARKSLELYIR